MVELYAQVWNKLFDLSLLTVVKETQLGLSSLIEKYTVNPFI